MNIIIEKNKFTVGNISTQLSNVLYIVSEQKDSVTFSFNSGVVKNVSIGDTTVNGVQMTTTNIDQLLAPLFNATSCNTETQIPSSPTDTCCAYTKAEYSEPLVFPTPIRSGHIVEFYKDGKLCETHEWKGWYWAYKGQKPILKYKYILKEDEIPLKYYGIVQDWSQENTYYLPAADIFSTEFLSYSVTANSIVETNDYFYPYSYKLQISQLSKETEKISKTITNIGVVTEIEVKYEDENQDLFTAPTQKVDFEDVSTIGLLFKAKGTSFNGNSMDQISTMYLTASFDVECNDFSLKDGIINNPNIKLYPISKEYPQVVLNDVAIGNNLSIAFEADTYSDGVYRFVKQADIDITNCTGYSSLSISGKDANTQIQNFKLALDTKNLKSVSIKNLSFSDAAFTALFNSLTAVSVNNLPLTCEVSNQVLTDAQKTALTNAGWKI